MSIATTAVLQPRELADTEQHTGIMVAFLLKPAVAKKLAIPGGEPATDMHLTLTFHGDVEELTSNQLDELTQAVLHYAKHAAPLHGTVSGVGRFNPSPSSDGKVPVIALVNVPGIQQWREELAQVLSQVGFPPDDTFAYTPHITLAYIDEDAEMPVKHAPKVALEFDEVTLAIGDKHYTYSLDGSQQLAEAASDYTDLRRITEDDPDYQRLHTQTVARLQRSLRQYIREEQRGEQGADSRFTHRHYTLMKQAYEAAHHEGQRDYWPAVSNRTVQHRYVQPDNHQTLSTLARYALGSVNKFALDVKHYVQQQKAGTLSEEISYTFDDLPSEYDNRVALQATITWSGLQDGYSAAGASDSATPYSLVYWNLGPVKTQHCSNCPTLAMNSPYDPPWAGIGSNQLSQTPGDGQTECGAGCKCSLDYSAPAEGSAALAELNAAKAQQWQDFMSFDGSPLPAITQAGVPGEPATGQKRVFTPLQKSHMDTHRNLAEQWNDARGNLPEAPDMFRRPDLSKAPRTPWGALTPYQQSILDRMTQNEIDWLHAVGQLNWPTPPYEPDIETKFAGWMKQAAAGTFTPWWKDYREIPAQEQELAAWLDEVAHSNRWPTPPPLDDDAAMRAWMAKVAQSVEWPPDSNKLTELELEGVSV